MLNRVPRAAACGLIALALAVAGCGSSGKSSSTAATTAKQPSTIAVDKAAPSSVPHAAESLSSFEKRLTLVSRDVAAGRCGPVTAFGKTSGLILPCNPAGRKQFAGFKVTGGATYGTGAVVEFTDADVASQQHVRGFPGIAPAQTRNTGFYALALGPDGRYRYLPAGSPPVFPGPYVGTKPNGWAGADASAVTFLKSVRDDNCAVWFKNTLTPSGMSQKQACQLGLTKSFATLRQALKSGQPIKLARLDGNAVFYYYLLSIGNRAGTLGVARDQPPAPAFIALGTSQAPAK